MKKYLFIAILCLTLGLAPFFPEPHIVGKVRWISGGAEGMQLIDWWDTILHGAPWVILIYFVMKDIIGKLQKPFEP